MIESIRALFETARRLTAAGQGTPFPPPLADALARAVGAAATEVARAAVAGAFSTASTATDPNATPPPGLVGWQPCRFAARATADALSAAAAAAWAVPGGRPAALALGALAGIADLAARAADTD